MGRSEIDKVDDEWDDKFSSVPKEVKKIEPD